MILEDLGWNPMLESRFAPLRVRELLPARVIREHKLAYAVYGEWGPLTGTISGSLRHSAVSAAELPAVGDWVAIKPRPREARATIHSVLPRKSAFTRKAAGGGGDEQVAAANVDHVFLVAGLDGDFNPRRIERYLTAAWNSGAGPVIVLNKADLCSNIEERVAQVESAAAAVPIHAVSATTRLGLDALSAYLQRGRTVALLGSSGVGKSSLVNALLDAGVQRTNDVRAGDDRGRHTTTHRELFMIPGGGMLIDTPGMRELGLWSDDNEGLGSSFSDIEELGLRCRFRDCRHEHEPGCAIRAGLEDGSLDAARWAGYRKLQRELHHADVRNDQHAARIEKEKWKKIHKAYKKRTRARERW